ncbi:MAG: Plug domain-containing protein, partial [Pseudomonadota bacterium]
MRKLSSLAATLLATTALSVSGTAIAQDAEAEAAEETGNEIIVTARFEEESIQDVPLPITAFDAETIERRNITELDDVARFTAGFSFEDFDGGNANPAIRGQSTLRPTSREQTVAAFLDGVYLPR